MQSQQPIPVQGLQQQPIVFYPGVINRSNNNGRVENYCWKQSKVLGVLQILIGIICFICNSVSLGLFKQAALSFVAFGFWNGIWFIIAGILGVVAGYKRNKCSIISFMVMCIISASFTTVLFSLAIVAAYLAPCPRDYVGGGGGSSSYNYYSTTTPPCLERDFAIATGSVLALMAVIEAIAAIWGSVICCKAVCCCASSACTQVMFIPQYCCTTQQTYPVDTHQAPFQQVSYYVWPAPNDPNSQFPINVNQMPPVLDPNTAMTWDPPPYNPSMQGLPAPPYELPTETKNGSIC